MVIDTFRALNKLIFIEISEYWSLSAKTKQPFLILSWTKACVLIWSAMWKRDNFLHSWHLTTTLIKMGLCYVSSGMKLNSKSSLVVSFTYNFHSFCSCVENLLYIFRELIWGVDWIDCVRNCCVCPMQNFGHWISETTLVIVKFRFVPKVRRSSVLCSKFRSKGLELSFELSHELSWKVRVNKKRNSRISFALLLHNTVHSNTQFTHTSPENCSVWQIAKSLSVKLSHELFCY